ncbi:MAG: aldo/keto reductase [Rhodospirillaceae bacterium]|nr:aldo/keto reductase [Rhodospirillaceae bacterium]
MSLSRRAFTQTTAVALAAAATPSFNAFAASEMRSLGKSGLKVPAVGIGCNNFGGRMDQAATQIVVDAALQHGAILFDTAESYGNGKSEEFLGAALAKRRKDAIIATKCSKGGRAAVIAACEASLKRLGTDYIDLYQLHRPDAAAPIEETLRAMDDLVKQGKVRFIGHSNFDGKQTTEAEKIATGNKLNRFISAQNQYSLLTRDIESDLVPACEANGVGILPYFPLESGMLTGKYKRDEKPAEGTRLAAWAGRGAERFLNEEKLAKVEKLEALSKANGNTLLQMAFGWLLSKPYIGCVIAGATKAEQVAENVKAASWRPSASVSAEIDKITKAA